MQPLSSRSSTLRGSRRLIGFNDGHFRPIPIGPEGLSRGPFRLEARRAAGATYFVGGLVTSEVWFGWATVAELRPNVDGLSFDEALLGGLVGATLAVLATWFWGADWQAPSAGVGLTISGWPDCRSRRAPLQCRLSEMAANHARMAGRVAPSHVTYGRGAGRHAEESS